MKFSIGILLALSGYAASQGPETGFLNVVDPIRIACTPAFGCTVITLPTPQNVGPVQTLPPRVETGGFLPSTTTTTPRPQGQIVNLVIRPQNDDSEEDDLEPTTTRRPPKTQRPKKQRPTKRPSTFQGYDYTPSKFGNFDVITPDKLNDDEESEEDSVENTPSPPSRLTPPRNRDNQGNQGRRSSSRPRNRNTNRRQPQRFTIEVVQPNRPSRRGQPTQETVNSGLFLG